jgi:hypothetical protein
MGVTLQGPLAGAVVVIIGLYLLFGPIEKLARKPSPIKRRRMTKQDVSTWMKVFFRGLGLVLLVLGVLLLAPVIRGA